MATAASVRRDVVAVLRWRVWETAALVAVSVGACAVPQPQETTPTAQQAFADATQRCEAGDGAACYAAGMIAVAWEGRAPGASEIADANFNHGCAAGNADSCRQLALRWAPLRPETAAHYRHRACELGDRESCVAVANAERATAPATPAAAPREPEPPAMVSGSCFFVAKAGIAVTNHHVVDRASEVALIDARGRVHAAKVLRDDKTIDLAVLEAVTALDIAPLPLAADSDVALGEPVFTIGFPVPGVLGNDPKFSEGSLGGQTGLGAAWLYQVTVPVQPGNSGGPLVDHRGLIVGVIVAKLRADRLGDGGVTPENVNFAIKSVELRRLLRGFKLSSAKPARTRQAAITRTGASVCRVIATPSAPPEPVPTPPPAMPEAPPDAPVATAPTAPPPGGPEQHRVVGDPSIYPDTATVNDMQRVGRDELRVTIDVCITATGEVSRTTIQRSSGFPAYDTKLLSQIARWRYSPRAAGNQQEPICRAVVFSYRLSDHKDPPSAGAPGQTAPATGAPR